MPADPGIRIGAQVDGTSGPLGAVHRVIVDAHTNHITDLVVRHGFPFGRERVVPLTHVARVADGTVHLDLDERGFAAMDGFTDDRFHAPDPSYSGPPGFDTGEFLLDATVAWGSLAGLGQPSPALGFPGGEQISPDDLARPALSAGMAILDVNGEKVGEIGEFSVTSVTGALTRLTLRHGLLFKHKQAVPLGWVDRLTDEGIVLNVTKSRVEALSSDGPSPTV